jgi:uncharacterized protein with ATP-grasp and redox domains
MQAQPECLRCIIDDLWGAISVEVSDKETQFKIIKSAFEFLAKNFNLKKIPSYYITEVHRIFKKISKNPYPFREIREKSNQIGLKVSFLVEKEAERIKNDFLRFSFLSKWAIAGNYLDFRTVGTGYKFSPSKLKEKFEFVLKEGLNTDHLKKIFSIVKKTKLILYIPDNVGEIAFDKLLIKELKNYGKKVIVAVRGGPITSDATMKDAIYVGIQEFADEIILAGPDTLGISWKEMSEDLKNAIKEVDLIVCKGQANFYVFSEYKKELKQKIVCLFRTKCSVVSQIFGKKENINIALLI